MQDASGLIALSLISLLLLALCRVAAITDPVEVAALRAIQRDIGDTYGRLSNWVGDDPCESLWTGVICVNINGTSHVQELRLMNMNLTGTMAPDFGNLSQLTILDVLWNNLTGSIPPEIGNLSNLILLMVSGNMLTGTLPPELGKLFNLRKIQIDQNFISGHVPASFQYLNKVKHFHMNNCSLNGSLPPELGRLQSLVHLLLDNNDLSGELPPEIANISTLLIIQLDNNHFNGTIPSSYLNKHNLTKLSLRNCTLSGQMPSFSNLTTLGYLDLSHNSFFGTLPMGPLSSHLTTIDLSFNQLNGGIPIEYFQAPSLEILNLRNNNLDGNITADNVLAHAPFESPDSVFILDLQNNNFTIFISGLANNIPNITFRLYGNPVCNDPSALPSRACVDATGGITNVSIPYNPTALSPHCSNLTCDESHNEELVYGLLSAGQCACAYPLEVGYRLKSPGFAIFQLYEESFEQYISSGLNVSLYQVDVSQYDWQPGPRLKMTIKLFPSNGTTFNHSEVVRLYSDFATFAIQDNNTFGPYEVLYFNMGFPYDVQLSGEGMNLSGGDIAGIVIGVVVFTAIAVGATMFLAHFYHIGPYERIKHHKRVKVAGVRDFTYKEMANATNVFDDSMQIGQGGYGKVYKGVLADGTAVAIKRAQQGSLQGFKEFYTEIELLSRVHHRNLVSLIGFCDDKGEQMLVYEFMENGPLRDHLNSESKTPLDFATRLQIAFGSANGILYLHTEANPPIFHRDIKTSNILLDDKKRAKVADFGLSKLAPIAELDGAPGGHVSTIVKGTPGYLDPEYFLTQKLTDKSDVYSFGVVLLELITGRQPIWHGRNLVREANLAYQAGLMMSIVDARMGPYLPECLEPMLKLAFACCQEEADLRPSMADVARELQAIWKEAPLLESYTSCEVSTGTETPPSKQHKSAGSSGGDPYVSSDVDGSGLISGNFPHVRPR